MNEEYSRVPSAWPGEAAAAAGGGTSAGDGSGDGDGGGGGDVSGNGGASKPTPNCLMTGAVLQDDVARVLGFKPAVFEPRHSTNIMNRILCYCNFKAEHFAKPHSKAVAVEGDD